MQLPIFTFSIFFFSVLVLVNSKVCNSVNVRNTPENIREFSDCRVIEGHLQIALIENVYDVTDYYNMNFSKLHEITDYLVVFKLNNLTSLDLILPKLSSIKGEKLFFGYSFVLFELPSLQEIGLTNLRNIGKGKVKIERCPKLCYVDTLDWQAIGVSHVTYNKSSTACVNESCVNECGGYCWNNFECQNLRKSPCHPLCVGCTQNNSPKHCNSCKYFNNSGTCVKDCPKSKLIENDSGRCVSAEECTSNNGTSSVFNNTCLPKCPYWFQRNSQGICIPSYVNVCKGIKISNHYDLEQMVGCTHINGSLEIALCEYVDVHHLERALGMIVSISEYLRIVRSPSITTLRFFKELRIIKGEKLWSRYYSLFVVQNLNLQQLWDFTEDFAVVIQNGEAFFQENPYLCSFEIDKLNVTANHSNTNGWLTNCHFKDLNVTIVARNSTNVTLSWEPPKANTTIFGYTIYYTAGKKNDSTLEMIDGFVDNYEAPIGWTYVFVPNNTVLLKPLHPYAYYRYYIKTSFASLPNQQTPVYDFRSGPGEPSEPTDLELESQTDTSVILRWKPPSFSNGNLSHYLLAVYRQDDSLEILQQRNYCIHPFKERTCPCPKRDEVHLFHTEGVCVGSNNFHCKKTTYTTEEPKSENENKNFRIKKRSVEENNTDGDIKEFSVNATGPSQSFIVDGLRHFTLYTFFLQACNHKEGDEVTPHCGAPEMGAQRTLKKKGADVITTVSVRVDGQDAIINWTVPEEPNVAILSYNIEYKRIGRAAKLKCVTSQQFERGNYEYKILGFKSRQYALRVRALSLAGFGDFTQWQYFEIYEESAAMNWLYAFLALFLLVILFILVKIIWRKYQLARGDDTHNLMLRLSVDTTGFGEEDEWKLDDETVEIIKELGQNSLGILYRRQED